MNLVPEKLNKNELRISTKLHLSFDEFFGSMVLFIAMDRFCHDLILAK